jgi:hypothetical protein
LWAQLWWVTKLLVILFIGALAKGLAASEAQPPLLIDSAPAPASATLDAAN